MSQNVADYIVQRLRQWDVDEIFGYPGDGINGLLGALGRAGNQPMFVQTRHEEMAALAATGYAKFSGKVGVCAATSGPGAIHLLNGLYDAKLDRVPVVAIVGQTARTAMGGRYQQEVDLQTLLSDVSGDYTIEVAVPSQLPVVLDRAFRTARSSRGPAVVIVPSDLQLEKYQPPAHAFKEVPSSDPCDAVGTLEPPARAVERAAEILNDGSRVAILIGQGARNAAPEVSDVAELTGAGVAKALLGKDVLPDDLPYVTGSIGLLGTRASYELMRDCDTLLIVGSNFPYSQYLPEFGQARAIQIDSDGATVGMRYPTEINIVADARAGLAALIPLLQRKPDRAWREGIEDGVRRWWSVVEQQSMLSANAINPMRIVWELSSRLPGNAIVTADSGSSTTWYARCLRFGDDTRGSLSGTLATMGSAVPYGIGAKFAHPDRPVIALVGDGAMQMNGLNELLTIARYRDKWYDQPFIVCVFHNDDLNQVTWEMRAMAGAPKFEPSQSLPEVSYADLATTMGWNAITVREDDAVAPAWDRALATRGLTLLDMYCDPEVPPLPPHVDYEQVKNLGHAVLRGDPNTSHLLSQGAKAKAQEFIAGR
ncbi:thiamine pyrophosphate-requiring protein [Mycobacteroides chelonae]|uniref:thiamine pyrophosphate-requiring protein n=1 Tax=Mycobacteroides chelonae TaxID=1774 RepID=UPI0004AAB920|nr:thiamine pyrophosphate-requiring protein [Mycobacteroides chelonae]OHT68133.1 thiamine pyrophosphate-requiring protein [Mycobacteroides chelonae]OHT75599.1 thiamine pyrophosphate-requiring protein [Mycobacteroides chelonae]OHT87198.1 thiamine pyrophosphate-requiring protein [Mycobacteroides chelonae]QQG97268.1 thiamine pyrophosphate-requiring protein [Mycobacteroides chelonae]